MVAIDDIANRYVEQWAELDPTGATHAGVAGDDTSLTDLSPDGFAARAELDRRTLAELSAVEPAGERERIAREAMTERLGLALEMFDAGIVTSEVNVISSAAHVVRSVFDLMPTAGEQAAAAVSARMAAVPAALAQWRRTLAEAAQAGRVAATKQIIETARQIDTWIDPDRDDVFADLAARCGIGVSDPLRADLVRAAGQATRALAETSQFLRADLAPRGRASQAVGAEHYALHSRYSLGATVDQQEAYLWGIEELARIETEMRTVSDKIVPGGTVDDAVVALDADPARVIAGKEQFRDWMQELSDRTLEELSGTHFDIPDEIRTLECWIAPTSDGVIYYTGPSEDFTRPGRMWWAVPQGIESFSTWREVTTVFHEGIPGHHLQIGQSTVRADRLNRWQRMLSWCSGHGEGWALYAERLMDELGYLTDPGEKLGMLDGQAMRAARVIVDIGMHLELTIPVDNPFAFHPGERWTPELGWEFMRAHTRVPDENLRFELNRYLGWPGQAPSYKLGERIWLQARRDAQTRQGPAFDLRTFHRNALDLGSLGLDPFRAALGRL